VTERNRDQVLGTEIRKLPVKLTDEELRTKSVELANFPSQLADAEEELKAAKTDYNAEKANIESRIASIRADQVKASRVVRTGEERREIDVEKIGDYQTGVVRFERVDSREVVQSRPMHDNEKQRELALQGDDDDEGDDSDRPAIDEDSVDGETPEVLAQTIDHGAVETPVEDLPALAQLVIASKYSDARTAVLACGDPALLGEVLAAEEGMRKKGPRTKLVGIIKRRINELRLNPPVPVSADDLSGEVVEGADLGGGVRETVPKELADNPADTTRDGGLFAE